MTAPARSAAAPVHDIAIAGAGAAGLALAVALKTELGAGVRVAAFDPTLGAARDDGRATMIAADGRRLLERAGAWPADAHPVAGLRITDSRLDDALRPTFLELGRDLPADEPFAHMVFDTDLRAALAARAEALGVTFVSRAIRSHAASTGVVTLRLDGGDETRARLLVAADGARSGVRAREKIAVSAFPYDQTALVATLAHEAPHGDVAVQHFLPGGPFAMLPLAGNRSSLVWSERRATAADMAALDDDAFLAEAAKRAGPDFGRLALAGPRGAFPLRFLLARSFVGRRVALIGDAAHVVHPLAGQGLNLGLRDVAALTRVLSAAARAGEDLGAPATLGAYESARRFEVAGFATAMDGLYRLFATNLARPLRDVGMGLVDRAPALKRRIVAAASGL
ncbi:2-octaprenyl-6-methoxyphenyl hydroxylase [Methylopila jiangsuensis]|uniref:2-octaprenyl-6-methoxyphenyl hydroxylase n=1 Tax=Methylopila jiangsuensis TaxID=586230 RepID=A0A9W6JCI7_9HYPH|nr:FAD-dependent monooxygenase [Methylopila jiangsuensis]MDR6287420.1 2-octaprenyl-6-methoxyphenol hydroxylase [Methylopila jiangsuensis]GLK75001.1 2-octaprenyl-6-methoxyphenyl hydroxylase [Methylopila jiangsuensis]